jgi:hypothetical protein
MSIPPISSLEQYFGELPDPREGQNVQHPLLSIVSIAICAVICGADNWVDVAMFGQAKQAWLETFLELPHGIPSHDTFGRVFRQINPAAFEACFSEWTQALCNRTAGEVVALDGSRLFKWTSYERPTWSPDGRNLLYFAVDYSHLCEEENGQPTFCYLVRADKVALYNGLLGSPESQSFASYELTQEQGLLWLPIPCLSPASIPTSSSSAGRQVHQPFQPIRLEALHVLIELAAADAELAARLCHIPQRLCKLQ